MRPPGRALPQATLLEAAPTDQHEGLIAAITQAQRYARHALRLAPDLAEAHRTLGMLLGYGSPEAQAHLRRAAELDPNSAENMIGLGVAHGAAGEFDQELAAYRRPRELDPLWFRTVGAARDCARRNGESRRSRGDREARFRERRQSMQHILLGRIAWIFGDYSEAARHWSIVARANSPRWSHPCSSEDLNDAKFALGLGHPTR